jgi:hypothetical protein
VRLILNLQVHRRKGLRELRLDLLLPGTVERHRERAQPMAAGERRRPAQQARREGKHGEADSSDHITYIFCFFLWVSRGGTATWLPAVARNLAALDQQQQQQQQLS